MVPVLMRVAERGAGPFWSAPRRLPRPLTFNANDELHLSFVYHCAHLYANIFQLKDAVADIEQVRQVFALHHSPCRCVSRSLASSPRPRS